MDEAPITDHASNEETVNDVDMDGCVAPEIIENYNQLLKELSYDAETPAFHAKTRWEHMLEIDQFIKDERFVFYFILFYFNI